MEANGNTIPSRCLVPSGTVCRGAISVMTTMPWPSLLTLRSTTSRTPEELMCAESSNLQMPVLLSLNRKSPSQTFPTG